jgi:hypothetical protein
MVAKKKSKSTKKTIKKKTIKKIIKKKKSNVCEFC